jgi:hypothetical protein
MGRQSKEDLWAIQEELEAVMANLQRDPTKMTQFRGWSSRNAERSKEARERCFHWSAPGTPQLPRLQYSDKLHKLSARLERFLQIGDMLHDDYVVGVTFHLDLRINFGWTRSKITGIQGEIPTLARQG